MRKHTIIALQGLFWVFGVIAIYFVYHKPFNPASAAAILLSFWRVVAAFLLIAVAGGLGTRLYSSPDVHPLARLALQAGLGLGILASFVLIIGSLIGLPTWLFWLTIIVLLILLHRPILVWLRQLSSLSPLWQESSPFDHWLAALCSIILLFPLVTALAPPLQFDSLMYHLVFPQVYLDANKITFLPWHVMSGIPQNMEMLFTWAVALGGAQAAAVLSWEVGALALLGLLGFARQRMDTRAAWVAVSALLAGSTFVQILGWAYIDSILFLCGLGVLVALDQYRSQGDLKPVILAGVFAGLSIGAKYTGGVIAVAGLFSLLWHIYARRDRLVRTSLAFGLSTLILVCPWLIKNFITTGNPFYPFFFSAGEMPPVRLASYQDALPYGNLLDVFFLPFRATFLGQDGVSGYMFAVGPLLLGLAAFFWVDYREKTFEFKGFIQNVAMIAFSGLLVWVVANQFNGLLIQTRYYLGLFPAFAMLAALGYAQLAHIQLPRIRLNRILNSLILLVMFFNLTETGLASVKQGALQVVTGIQEESAYLASNLGWFQPAMHAVKNLPEGSSTMLLYEPRSFYCLPVCESDEIMDRWKLTRAKFNDPQAIRQAWLEEGFTHLLFYKSGLEFLVESGDPNHSEQDLQSLLKFLQTLPDPVDFGGVYLLYSLVE